MSNIEHPKHYNLHPSGVECIELVRYLDFCLGNAVKYVYRFEHKNGVEDLEKALFYVNYLTTNTITFTDGMSQIDAALARSESIIPSDYNRGYFFDLLGRVIEAEENQFRKDFLVALFEVVSGVKEYGILVMPLVQWIDNINTNYHKCIMVDNTVNEGGV